MFKKVALWRGLAGLFCAVMVLTIFATIVLMSNSATINQQFGIATSKTVESDTGGGENIDSEYYKSTFGELNTANLKKLEEAAYEQTVREAEEGAVLLKNDQNALPLKSDERRVTLFGQAAFKPLYKTAAASTRVLTQNPELIVDLNTALTDKEFLVNQELFNAYGTASQVESGQIRQGYSHNTEQPLSFYQSQSGTWENYKQAAIVVIKREAGEGVDMSADQSLLINGKVNTRFTSSDVKNSLALQTREKDMLNLVKNAGFGKIIVLINTNYQMELNWLDEYNVDACLFIGTPGLTGFKGVVNILTGEANPSGKLVSTFAANSLSSPAIVNAATSTPKWSNWQDYDSSRSAQPILKDNAGNTDYVNVQQENIYIDYKYYETRYADSIMSNSGNAQSGAGSSFGSSWNYAAEMCYPFGFGLSYTSFNQTIANVAIKDPKTNTYTVTVDVENTGTKAGKSVVQLYVNTPYGDYEKSRNIEKSAILFVGFGKTDVIKPGEKVSVEIEAEEYLFASYDNTDSKGYVLTAGDYYFSVGNGAHEALNNVLAAREYTGLADQDGIAVNISKTVAEEKTHKWNMLLDTTSYKYGEDGTTAVTNQFDKMDINYWNRQNGLPEIKYLTRSDWAGTFPMSAAQVRLQGTEMLTLLQGDYYRKGGTTYFETPSVSTDKYAQGKQNDWKGVDNRMLFIYMKDVEYGEIEEWDKFIDQFTLDELAAMTGNYFGNKPIGGNINLPEKSGGDGCQGVGDKPYPVKYTDNAVLWPCLFTSLLSGTFNAELIQERGTLMANEALFLDQAVIWTGGGNLHRTPFGGRQSEYYSADANLSYLVGSIQLPAMEKLGILGGIKHFAGNDQESFREGVNTFYTEQSFRENALRGFEGALRKGKVNAVMSAFSRQGVKYTSSCNELNVNVLRGEWGFKGHVITDASSGATTGYKSHYTTSITTGTNTYCLDGSAVGGSVIAKSIRDNDDGYLLEQLRLAAKNTSYALSRSATINGLTANTRIVLVTPVWQILTYVAMGFFILTAIASLAMFSVSKIKTSKKKEKR